MSRTVTAEPRLGPRSTPDHRVSPRFEGQEAYEEDYNLGEPASSVYGRWTPERQGVIDRGREIAAITIPSILPPDDYRAGDRLPGNNQSLNALLVNTLASKLMYQMFPPGQPMCRFDPVFGKLKQAIDTNPGLWSEIELALSNLEMEHRKKAAAIMMATAMVQHIRSLLVVGNSLWKHIHLGSPTTSPINTYIVRRDRAGHQLLVVQEECVTLATLRAQHRAHFRRVYADELKGSDWDNEVKVYSICRYVGPKGYENAMEDGEWQYWQEDEFGEILDGTEVTTAYDDCPMQADWMVPVLGQDWGGAYCSEYQGDLEAVERIESALTDGTQLAAWALALVAPGGSTNINSVRKARNLDMIPGKATDITVVRSEKTSDLGWADSRLEKIVRRLGSAFLLQAAVRRDGERVTAEEVVRMAQELDQAMGGLYTSYAQGIQRRKIVRLVRLHEEANPAVDVLPEGLVEIQVITGTDAMGRSLEAQALAEASKLSAEILTPAEFAKRIVGGNLLNRVFASRGINTTGLIKSDQQVAQEDSENQQKAMQADMMSKAAGPVSGALAGGLMANTAPPEGGPPAGGPTPAPQ